MSPSAPVSRRCFLELGLVLGSAAASALPAAALPTGLESWLEGMRQAAGAGDRVVRVRCPAHNCGGHCLLAVHVRDGRIARIGTDDRPTDTLGIHSSAPASAAGRIDAASITPTASATP